MTHNPYAPTAAPRPETPELLAIAILLPGVMPDGEVIWACGNASLPDGAVSAGGVAGSDLANKYLPASCRGL
jgi:hypothetical protein